MSDMTTMGWQCGDDGVVVLTIDVAGRTMNVMTPEFLDDIAAAAARIAADDAIRGAVITSGKEAFMAGADLHELVADFRTRSSRELYRWCRRLQDALRQLETCGKPVAAAINGSALGGGLEVCLACHYRVAADKPRSVLGLPEVQVGLMPGGGGTQRLPRMLGIETALKLITEGARLSPADALEAGIVNELAAAGREVDAARRWVLQHGNAIQPWDRTGFKVPGGAGLMQPRAVQAFMVGTALLNKATQHNYPAPAAILSAVYEGTVLPIDKALDIETKYFVNLLLSPVFRNMARTLFISKGAADKLERRPAGPPRRKLTKLGILGAGMMGAGIAYVSARAGIDVVLLDRDDATARAGKEYSRKLVDAGVARGRIDRDTGDALLARIVTGSDFAQLGGVELVIEAVYEDREVKADVIRRAEAVMPRDAILASNTSTLPITGLAEASSQPARFIGIHFFSPVDRMPLVEVIVGQGTGDAAIAQALDCVRQLAKTPIVVNDSRGFYTSRVFSVYTREGIAMLAEGVAPALIENAAHRAGMPVGPLAVTDEVSLELSYRVGRQAQKDLGAAYVATPADEVLRRFVEDLERRGKRYGKGFYDYPEGGRKRLWPGLAEQYPHAQVQPPADQVQRRLLYCQAIESVRCLDENVVTHPADADLGSVFGWGFPAWTGGTISFIETVGLTAFVAAADELAAAHGEHFAVPESLRTRADQDRLFYRQGAAGKSRHAA